MVSLKHISPELLISESVAIVGSSGRLKKSPMGKEIDLYEDVVRFNRAPVVGWEELCGSKTTVRAANSHVFVGKPLNREGWVQKNTDFIKNLKDTSIILYGGANYWNRRSSCVDKSSRAFQMDPALNKIIKTKIGIEVGRQLTVGLMFIAICVDSGVVPDVYGFDIEEDRQRDHYWEKRGPASKFHNPDDEKRALKSLSQSGKIRIH